MARRRVSDETLLGAIGFVGVTAFLLSRAAVRGDTPAAPPVAPLLALLVAYQLAR